MELEELPFKITEALKYWPWIIGLAAFIGGTFASVLRDWLNSYYSNKAQKADHKQQRIHQHIEYLKENAQRIENQFNSEISGSAGVYGNLWGQAIGGDDLVKNDVAWMSGEQLVFLSGLVQSELSYLRVIAEKYDLQDGLLDDIADLTKLAKEQLTLDGLDPKDPNRSVLSGLSKMRVTISVLIELRVLYRTTIHLLIDKLSEFD